MVTPRQIFEKYFPIILPAILIGLIAGATILPFAAYGVPAILFREVETETIRLGSAISFIDNWSHDVYVYHGYELGSWAEGTVRLSVARKCQIEATTIEWVRQDKPINALFNTTADKQKGYNMTIYPNRYGFGIRYSLHYDVNVVYTPKSEGKPNPFAPSIEQRRKELVQIALTTLIEQYNKAAYIDNIRVFFSIDAPTLGQDQRYALNPDYIGIMGVFLTSVEYAEPTKGWAGAFIPKDAGTELNAYGSIEAAKTGATPLWHPESLTLLKPDEIYWYEKYAPAIAYFQTTILTFGSKLQLDTTKAFPSYWTMQFINEGGADPRATQWFRVDLGFKTKQIYDILGIELPEEVKQDIIKLVIPTTPDQYPYPTPPTTTTVPWLELLDRVLPVIYLIIGIVIVIIVIYVIVKTFKWRKT